MDLNNSNTKNNLEAAFGGESMANRKYLFFAEVCKKLGLNDAAKLFRETANQETEHAFAHFRLLHPELVVSDSTQLSDAGKKAIAARCFELAIEGETYEYTTMYPDFTEQAIKDRDEDAVAEFQAQEAESADHAAIFRKAATNFGFLTSIEHHHAQQYQEARDSLDGVPPKAKVATQKRICRQCSMIYDPVVGDPDSGIAAGTPFEQIPEDWTCPICGATKKNFVPYEIAAES